MVSPKTSLHTKFHSDSGVSTYLKHSKVNKVLYMIYIYIRVYLNVLYLHAMYIIYIIYDLRQTGCRSFKRKTPSLPPLPPLSATSQRFPDFGCHVTGRMRDRFHDRHHRVIALHLRYNTSAIFSRPTPHFNQEKTLIWVVESGGITL